jgi:hypothetical protein
MCVDTRDTDQIGGGRGYVKESRNTVLSGLDPA